MDPATADLPTLLAHEGFVRGLARRLARDDDEADELVQQTYVAALTHPPRDDGRGLHGWFSTVLKNALLQRRRGEARRTRREQAASRLDGAPSTSELLARESARRTLVEAVLSLGEPYRSAVVLRWLEGLPPREVAARLNVPVETVRTRLKRAVLQLRERLDRRHGGDRAAWLAAFVPLAGPEPVAPPRPARLAPVAAAAAGIALLAGGAIWLARGDDADRKPTFPSKTEWVAAPPPRAGNADAGLAVAAAPPQGAAASSPTRTASVRGAVIAAGRRLAAGARVTLTSAGSPPREVVADARGRFAVEGLAPGPVRISAASDDGATGKAVTVATAAPESIPVFLAPAPSSRRTLWVHVVDSGGRPVRSTTVTLIPDRTHVGQAPTDEAGVARFSVAVPRGAGPSILVLARADGGSAFAIVPGDLPDPFTVTLTLAPPGAIVAALASESPVSLTARVMDGASPVGLRIHGSPLAGTGFEFKGLSAGRYVLSLEKPEGLLLDDDLAMGPVVVQVRAGETTHVGLRLGEGAAVSGRVVRASDGRPAADAWVEWVRLPASDSGALADRRTVMTDGEGRWSARALRPGLWRAAASLEALVEVRNDVRLEAGPNREMEHRLVPGGSLSVVGEPSARLALKGSEADAPWIPFQTDSDGAAYVRGLPAGRAEVMAIDERGEPVMTLGTVDVSPARPAFLDARRGRRVAMSGVVTRGGAPVEGALVTGLGSTDAITGADGTYSFREPIAARVVLNSVVTPPDADGVALHFETGCMASGKEEIRRDFELPGGSAELEVLGLDGKPAAGLDATLTADAAGFVSLEEGKAVRRTDAKGIARWVGLPEGAYAAVMRFPSGAVARRSLDVTEEKLVRARAEEPKSVPLVVQVVEPGGGPATGVLVTARFLARGDDPGSADTARFAKAVDVGPPLLTDAEGRVRFPALADGVLLVSARSASGEEAPPQVVTVGPDGEARVVLSLRPVPR